MGALQQNGVAERMNCTIMKRARCILSTASLGQEFWVEAINIAAYLIDKSPTTTLTEKIPKKVWTGKPINYSHLVVFGCNAYAHVLKEQRSKLDTKSKEYIFLGYGNGTKGYSLWDIAACKLIISQDVVFNEKSIQKVEQQQTTIVVPSKEIKVEDGVVEKDENQEPKQQNIVTEQEEQQHEQP